MGALLGRGSPASQVSLPGCRRPLSISTTRTETCWSSSLSLTVELHARFTEPGQQWQRQR